MEWVTVSERLCFGALAACEAVPEGFAVVHACKDPCHRKAADYTIKSLPKDHPQYLALERGHHLYLNLIDPPAPLFQKDSFDIFLRFVDEQIKHKPVLIHCNKGESRAPSLALFYAAKRLKIIAGESYAAARADFEKRYPYKPGQGIATFLEEHWLLW